MLKIFSNQQQLELKVLLSILHYNQDLELGSLEYIHWNDQNKSLIFILDSTDVSFCHLYIGLWASSILAFCLDFYFKGLCSVLSDWRITWISLL